MKRIMIWDIPTRLFHWIITVGFFAAFGIAQFTSDESPLFQVHMIIGLLIGLMLIFRVVWGFFGTKHARFSSFLFSPRQVIGYARDAFARRDERLAGHNPGASYAIFTMLFLLAGIVATGLLMQNENKVMEELHELFSYLMIAVVSAHILGVTWHTIRHKENIVASMFHGYKQGDESERISSSRPLAALVLLIVVSVWTAGLFRNHDAVAQQTTLPLLGTVIQLGDPEHDKEKHGSRHGNHERHGNHQEKDDE